MQMKASDVESEDLGYSSRNIRRSSRLTSKKREASCLGDSILSGENGFKCKLKSPKTSNDRHNLVLGSNFGAGSMIGIQKSSVNGSAILEESAFASPTKSSRSVPSFEFHVRSEKGINLFVDLNSSPSDWLRNINNEVCLCPRNHKAKFQNFRQELEYLGNSSNLTRNSFVKCAALDNGTNEGHAQLISSPKSIKSVDGNVVFAEPDGSGGSLEFSMANPCSVANEISVHSGINKEVPPFSTSIISSTESFPGVGDIKSVDSILADVSQAKSCSVVNFTSNGSQRSHTEEEQDFKLGENCMNTVLQDNCSLENPTAQYPCCSPTGYKEMKNLVAASHQGDSSCCGNICSQNLAKTIHNAKTSSSRAGDANEYNQDTCRNYMPESVAAVERGNTASLMEVSSSQLENRLRKSVLDDSPKRKRHDCTSDDSCDPLDGRVLRSEKHLGEQVLRRSTRLLPKVQVHPSCTKKY